MGEPDRVDRGGADHRECRYDLLCRGNPGEKPGLAKASKAHYRKVNPKTGDLFR